MANPSWTPDGWVTDELLDFYALSAWVKQPQVEPGHPDESVFDAMANPPEHIDFPTPP